MNNSDLLTHEKASKMIEDALLSIEQARKRLEPKWSTQKNWRFHCDHCAKDIDGRFVKVHVFRNHRQMREDVIGESFKVYCPKCWNNEISKHGRLKE